MIATFNFHEFKSGKPLPSPSGTVLSIIELVKQQDSTLEQLAKMVQSDPALSSKILSLVNSAALNSRRPVINIMEAVQRLGMKSVSNIALSLSLISNNSKGQCQAFDYDLYWTKSLATAVAIMVISSQQRTVAAEEAFTIGLLSYIGELALATAWPEEYSACLQNTQDLERLKQEHELFAVDHRELTIHLLKDWGFPDIFIEALKISFGEPVAEASRTTRFASQLNFSRQVSQYCIANNKYRTELFIDLEQQALSHNLEGEAFTQFINDTLHQWADWGKLIDIKTDIRVAPLQKKDNSNKEQETGLDILLVDDDPNILSSLNKQLTVAGHHVNTRQDGQSALEYILEHTPQLIITDRRMQAMDGLELCKTLRNLDIGKNLYLILITATDTESEIVEAFDAGIDDYLSKPVNHKILLARIRAGQRIANLQQALEKEKQEMQRANAELAVANRRMNIIANTDILTNLPNRRYALSRLTQEWEANLRYHRSISLLMLDLDHFKSINDSLGHDVGDLVLIHVAKLMKAVIRATDIACRFGGEEFLIIAPNTEGKTAVLLAERIRKTIQSHQPKKIKLTQPITISIGVASSTGNKPGWNKLIKMADTALYKVKARSRNAVELAR